MVEEQPDVRFVMEKSILLVEDDVVDQMSVKRALKELRVSNNLAIANNGLEGLEYLKDLENQPPGIILLDINMPKMNGLEFLQVLKKDGRLRKIPVIILTTSKEDQDRLESFELGVAGYMLKPVDYTKFVEVIRTIHSYWKLSQLPDL
jgi:CheY-like chemotaxis protein